MSPLIIEVATFVFVFGGALFGMWLRAILKESHLASESKEVVRISSGLIATMTALVLGLLVASAKSSFDSQYNDVVHLSADVILVDRALAHCGPMTKEVRATLREEAENILQQLWPQDEQALRVKPNMRAEALFDKLQEFSPTTDAQRELQKLAQRISVEIGHTRWLLYAQQSSTLSTVLLGIVVFWTMITFVSFGLFSPRNVVTLVALALCAFSVATALALILELNRPFDGIIRIPSDPLRNAISEMGAG